jgi:hypothetical protein
VEIINVTFDETSGRRRKGFNGTGSLRRSKGRRIIRRGR